ncbi:MAG TPA: hypothetical protein VK630_15875 [Reyranella sp.]|nr:hypothetical protein [Reyranella sp.]
MDDGERLTLWVIYDNPSDQPGKFVLRRQYASAVGTGCDVVALVFDTLAQAREALPPGLVNIGRMQGDDPVITEVWV